MTLPVALILAGALLVWAGWTGHRVTKLLTTGTHGKAHPPPFSAQEKP